MRSLVTRHPDDGQLLRLADGALSAWEARRVRRHLESCWDCRATLQDIESTMGRCVRYRKDVAALVTPPAPWQDLTRDFDQIDAGQAASSWRTRWASWVSPAPALRWSATTALALLLCGILVYQFRETPSVQAAALLKKAVAASASRPESPRRLRVRTSKGEFSRAPGRTAASAGAPDVAALFTTAQYNWDDPLSARSYQAWREGLSGIRDEVAAVRDEQDPARQVYRIRTITESDFLAVATLTLRMEDLRPSQARFEFRNQDWVEVSEAPNEPNPLTAAAKPSEPEPAPPAPERAPEPAVVPVTAAAVLQVVAALHRVGADLGDPIEITRETNRIVVGGTGVSPARQQQIKSALADLPRIEVRFNDAAAPDAGAEPADELPEPSRAASPLQAEVERQLGGRVPFERFSAQVLDRSEAAMAQAYALRRLAQQFPVEAEQTLSAEDRLLLAAIAREHVTALAQEITALRRITQSVLPDADRRRVTAATTIQWQQAVEQTFRAASSTERLLATLLGATPPESAGSDVKPALATGLLRLQADLEQAQRLLRNEPAGRGQ